MAQGEGPDSPTRALDADAASASFGAARAALSSQIPVEPASPKAAAAKRSGDRSPGVRDSPGLLSLAGKSPLSFSGESPFNRERPVEGERPMVKSRVETASDQLRRGRELLKEDKPLLAEAMVRLALQGFQDCLGAHHLETSRAARSLMEALVKQARSAQPTLSCHTTQHTLTTRHSPRHTAPPHHAALLLAGRAAQAHGG